MKYITQRWYWAVNSPHLCMFELKMSSLMEISDIKVLRLSKVLRNEREKMCKIKRFLTSTVIPMQNLEMKLSLRISYKK